MSDLHAVHHHRPTPPAAAGGPPPGLLRLGWDDGWTATLDRHVDLHPELATAVVGRVTRADRGACDVLLPQHGTPNGARSRPTVVHGARWSAPLSRVVVGDPEQTPAAGDWVLLAPPDQPSAATDRWVAQAVLERRTAVRRAEAEPGSSRSQVLAANPDVVAVVEPMPGVLGRLERLLALAWSSGARPVVVLTKADLHHDPDGALAEVAAVAPGVEVYAVATPDGSGLEPLRALLAEGLTLALVGASGVGKSTLLNALVSGSGTSAEVMATQEIRGDGKGRHTTVTRELHLCPTGGAVLDTPGVRTVGLSGGEELDEVFPEVAELAARCRFADCAHRTEPGCAVQDAVADGELPERRLASYRRLEREALARAARVDARLRAAQVQEHKLRQRAYRQRPDKKR